MRLEEHVFGEVLRALERIPPEDRSDIYALSLFVYDADDDPRRPTLTVGYNTEAQVAACTPGPGESPHFPTASDSDEARWNYAFWLQNDLSVVCDEECDRAGAELLLAWAKQHGWWFSDEEEAADFDAALDRVRPLTAEFVWIAVRVVQRLHKEAVLERVLGRGVPILIHELEYYEEIARQNEVANSAESVRDFARWVRNG